MKTFHIKSIVLLLIISFISCQDVLDKDPLGILDAGSFFKTADDAEQALNAAYGPLLFSNNNNNFLWVFSVVSSEIAIAGGDGSRAGIVEACSSPLSASVGVSSTRWRSKKGTASS